MVESIPGKRPQTEGCGMKIRRRLCLHLLSKDGHMKSKALFVTLLCLFGSTLAFSQVLRDVRVTEIPGVVMAGAKCTLAWSGTDNADGIVGTADGGLIFA